MTALVEPRDAAPALDRAGLGAALICYVMWGVFPLLFHAMAQQGASAWEIVGWRMGFSIPVALALVAGTGRLPALAGLVRQPRVVLLLTVSAIFIALNWMVYVWAVNAGQTLSASLGYYINPLINAALGAVLFREKITRAGYAAFALAAAGVAIQAFSVGANPWIPLVLAGSFSIYGVVRRQVDADAQTGLLAECVILSPLAITGLSWLQGHGGLRFGHSWDVSLLLMAGGPVTVAPLVLFAFAVRRLPFSVVGFTQFITPTLQFGCGLLLGERLTTVRILSFALIWIGAGVFATDLAVRLRREAEPESKTAA